ncbi:MAG: protein kinase [Planctomycetota bacterium]
MSGTDPDPLKGRIDRTQAWRPTDVGGGSGSPPPGQQPDDLPKIPGITLHFELARGGMGVVYSGRQDFLDRRVAVKLLSVELGGESFVQRFQREAKILAGIKHANIVACHMAGQTDAGQSYLVMEFIDGPSLKKWIGDHGSVPVRAALRTTRAIGQALGHAHTLGIIHRDVKPENILLETVTSTALDVLFPFTPKVVDLGLARSSAGSAAVGLTSPGSVMGTPATMSPEQYDEPDEVDFRTDIYGLGCVLYEMLVGQPAYRGKRLTDIIAKKREPVAPNPCLENPDVPTEVGGLVQWMLATSRDDRPASYKALDERIAALIDSMSVPSRPTKPKRVVGDETGATIVSVRPPQPEAKSVPPKTQVPKPPANVDPAQSSANLLRSSELNFLAEGLGEIGAAAAPPAFKESGAGTTRAVATNEIPAPVSPASAPASKRGGMVVLTGIAVVALGVVGWLVFGPKGGSGGSNADPAKAPKIEKVGGPAKWDLAKSFTLEAVVPNPEGRPLSYSWEFPSDLIAALGATDKKNPRFQFLDGLPGVPAEIRLVVRDGAITSDPWKHVVVVGECRVDEPLTDRSQWPFDRREGWSPLIEGGLSCQARDKLRTITGSLDDDTWWEWFGRLKSAEDLGPDKTEYYATIGGRFEIGGKAWEIVCKRTGTEGVDWSIEAMTVTRKDDVWERQPMTPPVRMSWSDPPDSVDEQRALFSVQRRGTKLVLQVGRASKPPAEEAKEVEEWGTESAPIDLPKDSGGSVTWFVDKGRGVFQVKRR